MRRVIGRLGSNVDDAEQRGSIKSGEAISVAVCRVYDAVPVDGGVLYDEKVGSWGETADGGLQQASVLKDGFFIAVEFHDPAVSASLA